MANVIMKGKDTIGAGLAECYVTVDNKRYNFMQAINLEAKIEKNKTEAERNKIIKIRAYYLYK